MKYYAIISSKIKHLMIRRLNRKCDQQVSREGGVCGVMVTVIANGHDDNSSNPG